MGKVIKKKLNGMSWWMKTSLILLLTLATSVFMYQGWYMPKHSEAAAATYQLWYDAAAPTVGSDGAVNVIAGATSTTYGAVAAGGTNQYRAPLTSGVTLAANTVQNVIRPAASIAASTTEFVRTYTPVRTSANNQIAANATASVQLKMSTVGTGTGTCTLELYEYNDIAGIVGAMKGTGSATYNEALTTNQTLAVTMNNPKWTVAVGNRLVVLFKITNATTSQVSLLYGSTTGTTGGNSSITFNESAGGGTYQVTNCSGCHGYGAPYTFTDGTARNNPVGTFPGTHNAHVIKNTMTCNQCHTAPATETSADFAHANGTVVVLPAVGYSASSCTTTLCHGSASPTWGTNSAANIDTCTKCHGTPSVSPATPLQIMPTTPTTAAHTVHLSTTTITTPIATCTECHESVTVTSSTGHMDGVKTIQFSAGPRATNAANGAITPTNSLAGCATTWCHGGDTTKIPQNKPARTAPTWGTTFGTTSTLGDALGASSTNTGSGRCAQCHGFPPATSSHAGVTGFTGAKPCSQCHSNVTSSGTFVDTSLHINGIVEGGSCTACHSTGGTGAAGTRVAVASQFTDAGNSHHYQGAAAIDGKTCYACHWESDASGNTTANHTGVAGKSVDLVIWNSTTRPTVSTPGVTFVAYSSGGAAQTRRSQLAKINNVCLGCHSSQNANTAPFPGDANTTSQYSPEPRMVPALAKTSVQSRYSSTITVPWSNYAFTNSSGQTRKYGTNQKKLITKALSAHGNAVKNQFPVWDATLNGRGEDEKMADAAASSTLSSNRNVFCYDCHNSHGSDAGASGAITSSYSSATGRYKGGLLKSTTAGKGGYTVTYKPAARTINYKNYSGSATTAATFNAGASLCNDCHNTDTSKVNISRPWSVMTTYSSTKAIVGYWSTPYFDNYTVNSTKRTAYKAGGAVNSIKDLRKPMGGHFGSSINGTSASHSGNINGLCTNCHDPHGVSSAMTAVNRGKSVPLLKGTWVTSPYREDRATPVVKRGGGSNFTGVAAMGGMPGYNIDQNTLIALSAPTKGGAYSATVKSDVRKQAFVAFPGAAGNALSLHTEKTPADFAGLCIGCHAQATLTNATAPSASNWMSMQRVHQTVAGWAATTGTNANGTVHAYTCSKCHAPHVSRLPRLLITNCLDVRHTKQSVSGGAISATTVGTPGFTYGNNLQSYASSAYGAGRFPSGGSRYSGTPGSSQNNGPWYFQTVQPAAATYPSNCHNATNAGGTTYNPTTQIWNKRTRW